MEKMEIPQEIYNSDKACAEFLLSLNQRLSRLAEIERALKEAKETASDVMLSRLCATGQKHFAFEGIGTFSKSEREIVEFPSAENGGSEAATAWLKELLEKGVITPEIMLDSRQSRLSTQTVVAIEAAAEAWNRERIANNLGGEVPKSPFNRFKKIVLSTPRTRKA